MDEKSKDKKKNSKSVKKKKETKKIEENILEKPKKDTKKNKVLLVAILATIVIILLCVLFKVVIKKSPLQLFTNDASIEKPVVYVVDDELKFISSKLLEPVSVGKVDKNSVEGVVYSNSGKYFIFKESENLYLVDTKKNGEKEKLVADVSEYYFTENDKYIVYTNTDGDLYTYDFKDKQKLDFDIDRIISVTNSFVLYKKEDGLYMRSIEGESDKKKITADCYDARLSSNEKKIFYKKEVEEYLYDYYVYTIENENNEKVLSNVSGVYSYSEDLDAFIYGVEVGKTKDFNIALLVEDDMKAHDDAFREYTYEDYWNDVIDYEDYYANRREASEIEDRNRLRTRLAEDTYKNYKINDYTYDVYYVKKDEKIKLASGVSYTNYADVNTKRIAFTKSFYDTSNKKKLSEIDSLYDITKDLEKSLKYKIYFSNGNEEKEIGTSDTYYVDTYGLNNDLYYLNNGELFYGKINNNNLEDVTSIDKKVIIIDVGNYKNSLLYASNVNENGAGDLKIIKDGKTSDIQYDANAYSIKIFDSKKLFYYSEYKNYSGNFMMYDGENKKLFDDVTEVTYIKDNYMYVIKDYSSKAGTADLYRYRGDKIELIDYSFSNIWLGNS